MFRLISYILFYILILDPCESLKLSEKLEIRAKGTKIQALNKLDQVYEK